MLEADDVCTGLTPPRQLGFDHCAGFYAASLAPLSKGCHVPSCSFRDETCPHALKNPDIKKARDV